LALLFCFLAFIVFVAAAWRNEDEYIAVVVNLSVQFTA